MFILGGFAHKWYKQQLLQFSLRKLGFYLIYNKYSNQSPFKYCISIFLGAGGCLRPGLYRLFMGRGSRIGGNAYMILELSNMNNYIWSTLKPKSSKRHRNWSVNNKDPKTSRYHFLVFLSRVSISIYQPFYNVIYRILDHWTLIKCQ